jgi:Domain of unknown function (DUF2019)
MKKIDIPGASTEELVTLYERAATEHGRGRLQGTPRETNRAADTIAAIYRELRGRGDQSRQAILPLLLSDNPSVRGWAGAHALEFAPEQGRAILEDLAKEKGLIAFSAKTTLKVWAEGKLQFP